MKILKHIQTSLVPKKSDNNLVSITYKNENYFLPFKGMTKAQELLFKGLNDSDKINYLFSFLNKPKKIKRIKKEYHDNLGSRENHHFLKLLRSRCDVNSFKRPLSDDFHFGIEIECIIPWSSIGVSPSTCGGEVECYTCEGSGTLEFRHRDSGYSIESECPACEGSGTIYNEDCENENSYDNAHAEIGYILKNKGIKGCQVHSDSSIDADDDYFSIEISCLTSDFKNLEKLCKVLNDLDAEVNSSCGLHVHLDCRSKLDLDTFKNNAENSLDVLYKMLPESRRSNSYCVKRWSYDKYSAFTTNHLKSYGTVECRAHSGTTNFEKIKNWCLILKSIYDHETLVGEPLKSVKTFSDTFGLDPELKRYMLERIKLFKNEEEEN